MLAAGRRVGFKEYQVGAACSQTEQADWCGVVLLYSDLEYVVGLSGGVCEGGGGYICGLPRRHQSLINLFGFSLLWSL